MSSVGLEDLAFSEVFVPSRVENGRKLCEMEKNRRVSDKTITEGDLL